MKLKLILGIVILFFWFTPVQISYGHVSDSLEPDPKNPLGEVRPVKDVVSEFKKTHKTKVILPKYIPFKPTHTGGDIYTVRQQQRLRIDYVKNNYKAKLLTVEIVNGSKMKIGTREKNAIKIKLKNGVDSLYISETEKYGYDILYFTKDNNSYRIAISNYNENDQFKELEKVALSIK